MRACLLFALAFIGFVTSGAAVIFSLKRPEIESKLTEATRDLIGASLGKEALEGVTISFDGRNGRVSAICRDPSTLNALSVVSKKIGGGREAELRDKIRRFAIDLKLSAHAQIFAYQRNLYLSGQLPEKLRDELRQDLTAIAKRTETSYEPRPIIEVMASSDVIPPAWRETVRAFLEPYFRAVDQPHLSITENSITLMGKLAGETEREAMKSRLLQLGWTGEILNQLAEPAPPPAPQPQGATEPLEVPLADIDEPLNLP